MCLGIKMGSWQWCKKIRKKHLKWILLGLFIVKIILQDALDHRPFIFERYRTTEELAEGVRTRFPPGTHFQQVLDDLEKSRADCSFGTGHSYPSLCLLSCNYTTSIFSLHPLEEYEVWVYLDQDDRVVTGSGIRRSGFGVLVAL